jgi:valyl-tRNA synthetase
MNVPPSKKAQVYVVSKKPEIREIFENGKAFFSLLAYASDCKTQVDKIGISEDAVSVVIQDAVVYIPFDELVNISQEIERLEKEQKRLIGEVKRSVGMLANENFVAKAPEIKIKEEKNKLEKYEQMLLQIVERLEQLK